MPPVQLRTMDWIELPCSVDVCTQSHSFYFLLPKRMTERIQTDKCPAAVMGRDLLPSRIASSDFSELWSDSRTHRLIGLCFEGIARYGILRYADVLALVNVAQLNYFTVAVIQEFERQLLLFLLHVLVSSKEAPVSSQNEALRFILIEHHANTVNNNNHKVKLSANCTDMDLLSTKNSVPPLDQFFKSKLTSTELVMDFSRYCLVLLRSCGFFFVCYPFVSSPTVTSCGCTLLNHLFHLSFFLFVLQSFVAAICVALPRRAVQFAARTFP